MLLSELNCVEDLRAALLASSRMPWVGGPPASFRERRFLDGGLAESIPYRTAVALVNARARPADPAAWGGRRAGRVVRRSHHHLAAPRPEPRADRPLSAPVWRLRPCGCRARGGHRCAAARRPVPLRTAATGGESGGRTDEAVRGSTRGRRAGGARARRAGAQCRCRERSIRCLAPTREGAKMSANKRWRRHKMWDVHFGHGFWTGFAVYGRRPWRRPVTARPALCGGCGRRGAR